MKKFLSLFFVLALAVSAHAVTRLASTGATGTNVLFQVDSSATAITGTGTTTTIPPGSVLLKLIILPGTTAANSVTMTVWDAPNGLTSASGAKTVLPTLNAIIPTIASTGPYTVDFSSHPGTSEGQAPGYVLKNYLVVASAGTNTPNVIAVWRPSLTNKIQGTNGSN